MARAIGVDEFTPRGGHVRPALLRYGVAVVAFALSLAFRYATRNAFGTTVPYLQFYPAVLIAAWYGGAGPGLLTTAASVLAAMYFFLPPSGLAATGTADLLSLGVFAATGLIITWLNHRLQQEQESHRVAAATAEGRAERLNAILNTTVDGIIVIDAKGRIEAFNNGAERLFGYPESEVLGRNVNMLMPSPYYEEHDRYLEQYLSTGQAKIIGIGREVTARRRDGTEFPVHLSVGEMHIAGERKFTGMLTDLTSRVGLEDRLGASEARWRAIVESAVDGIIVIDAHGRVETFNPAAERLFGYTAAEVMGRNVDMLMPSPYREEHDIYLSRYLATGHAKIIGIGREVQGRRKDGATFPVHLAVGEIIVQGERKFTGILHDLTARVRMEAQVREQAALVRLGEMAAVIAHEVKNPLAGIRGAIQVVASRAPEGDQHVHILKEIISRIDSLDAMIKDLLLFARPPSLKRTTADVVSLVKATVELLDQDPLLRDVKVNVKGTAPPLSADVGMMKIVFQNVLINSAHAMRGNGRIDVTIAAVDSRCDIAFADTGPGIPEDIRDKIFTPFFTTKSRGSGLGLPTAKRLVEAHGGEIAVTCPPGGGTTVVVRLPLAPP
jgi:two-component system sensor kinase FixL